MRSFSDENESIIDGWGGGGGAVAPQIICRSLREGSEVAIRDWWQQHFGRKFCKLETKAAHFSTQTVHFSHQCLLLFPASCQRHWCRHYPSSIAVIMLLANAWLKDLICKLSVQHLPTSSSALSLFSVSLTALQSQCFVVDGSQWSAEKHPFAFYSLSGWRCNCTSVCIIQEESMVWMDIALTWMKL